MASSLKATGLLKPTSARTRLARMTAIFRVATTKYPPRPASRPTEMCLFRARRRLRGRTERVRSQRIIRLDKRRRSRWNAHYDDRPVWHVLVTLYSPNWNWDFVAPHFVLILHTSMRVLNLHVRNLPHNPGSNTYPLLRLARAAQRGHLNFRARLADDELSVPVAKLLSSVGVPVACEHRPPVKLSQVTRVLSSFGPRLVVFFDESGSVLVENGQISL